MFECIAWSSLLLLLLLLLLTHVSPGVVSLQRCSWLAIRLSKQHI
jgi:hypothetical protein